MPMSRMTVAWGGVACLPLCLLMYLAACGGESPPADLEDEGVEVANDTEAAIAAAIRDEWRESRSVVLPPTGIGRYPVEEFCADHVVCSLAVGAPDNVAAGLWPIRYYVKLTMADADGASYSWPGSAWTSLADGVFDSGDGLIGLNAWRWNKVAPEKAPEVEIRLRELGFDDWIAGEVNWSLPAGGGETIVRLENWRHPHRRPDRWRPEGFFRPPTHYWYATADDEFPARDLVVPTAAGAPGWAMLHWRNGRQTGGIEFLWLVEPVAEVRYGTEDRLEMLIKPGESRMHFALRRFDGHWHERLPEARRNWRQAAELLAGLDWRVAPARDVAAPAMVALLRRVAARSREMGGIAADKPDGVAVIEAFLALHERVGESRMAAGEMRDYLRQRQLAKDALEQALPDLVTFLTLLDKTGERP